MSTITIKKISITQLQTDAVVNAANVYLAEGSGVCGYIFRDAGSSEMTKACNRYGHCGTGDAVITPGFKLPARYVIHAVGPVWTDGSHNEPKLLYSAYMNSLKLSRDNNIHSIGFPLISAGIYGYPVNQAWEVALSACRDYLMDSGYDIDITFAVLDDAIMAQGRLVMEAMNIGDGMDAG